MSKFSPEEAKALYEELLAHTDTVGHASCGNPLEEQVFRFMDRTKAVADDYVEEGPPESDTADGPPRMRFHVASPWHALIHLFVNNRGWLEGKQGPVHTPLIYRGQRDWNWSVVPSLLRSGVDRLVEEQKLQRFRSIARKASDPGLRRLLPDLHTTEALSDLALEATAQHYGVKTSLLDFTADPAVAVWFACQGGSHGDIASVFALPMAMAELFETDVILCHPLALRPYRQHGLFIRDSLQYLKRLLIEVRFPSDPQFRIERDRLPTAMLPEDQWWHSIAMSAEADYHFVPPTLSRHDIEAMLQESSLHLLQMLMELTAIDISEQAILNGDAITQIARQNGQLLLACESSLRRFARGHFVGTMGQFVVPKMVDRLVRAARR